MESFESKCSSNVCSKRSPKQQWEEQPNNRLTKATITGTNGRNSEAKFTSLVCAVEFQTASSPECSTPSHKQIEI